VIGLTDVCFEKDRPCTACQAGKQVGTSRPSKNIMMMLRPLELLHVDLFRPVAYLNIGGCKYGLVIVDDYSRFTYSFCRINLETQETPKRFLRQTQNEFELKVKKIMRTTNQNSRTFK
jgi:hypothetical protein